ncbi:MAG: hypothetical protein GX202_01970, partial [Firmicutes bacterium]|nr:hypothetical protein [Bacillota bacterium]
MSLRVTTGLMEMRSIKTPPIISLLCKTPLILTIIINFFRDRIKGWLLEPASQNTAFASKSATPFIICKEESRGGGMVTKKKFFWLTIVWRREYLFAIIFLFVCGFFGGLTRRDEPVDAPSLLPSAIAGKTIIIDAGHGGFDPGAVGRSGLEEKMVTLDIAKRLKRYFSRVGVYVIMTREKDMDYSAMPEAGALTKKRRDLLYRVRMANESRADLLISI